MKKKKGFTLIELLVVIAIIAMLLAILMPALGKVKKLAQRLVCGTNLKGMANGMEVYAFDYEDDYPSQGGKGWNIWTDGAAGNYWKNSSYEWSKLDASGSDGTYEDNAVTISASLYMLVKVADVGVKSFICAGGQEEAFVNDFDTDTINMDMVELNDFGPTPVDHYSYSYQMPYGNAGNPRDRWFPARGTSNPANAIMADKNPWFDSRFTNPDKQNTTSTYNNADNGILAESFFDMVALYTMDGEIYKKQVANSGAHDREGQNVLFGDGHVSFEKTPNVGAKYDNIYTSSYDINASPASAYTQYAREVGYQFNAIGSGCSQHKDDSFLVNDDDGF